MSELGPYAINTVVVGDCLEVLGQLPDASVMAVVTDPPYGVGVADWDGEIPPQECLSECLRVSCGPVVWFGAAPAARQAEVLSYRPLPDRIYIWHNPFTRVHSDGAFWQYHPIYVWGRLSGMGRDVVRMVAGRDGSKPVHPTQKPLPLMAELVRAAAGADVGVIMDPFCGSGSTLVAAKRVGLPYFGCDISEKYVRIAERRLAKVLGAQLMLRGMYDELGFTGGGE